MRFLIFFTYSALSLPESAPFISLSLIIAAIEAAKVSRFHPLNTIFYRLGASSLSMCAFNAIVDHFTSPALALYEYAPFMSSILLMTELEAVKEDRFHPLNIFWHRWGASSLSMCAFNVIVDFFTFPALALCEYALFMSSTLIIAATETIKEGIFHPLNR